MIFNEKCSLGATLPQAKGGESRGFSLADRHRFYLIITGVTKRGRPEPRAWPSCAREPCSPLSTGEPLP